MLNYICEQNLPTDEKESDLLKFLKDFLYDKNDVLIALIILVLAGALIVWRVDVIMEYPSTLVAEIDVSETTDDTAEHANEDTSSETSSGESLESSGAAGESESVMDSSAAETTAPQGPASPADQTTGSQNIGPGFEKEPSSVSEGPGGSGGPAATESTTVTMPQTQPSSPFTNSSGATSGMTSTPSALA